MGRRVLPHAEPRHPNRHFWSFRAGQISHLAQDSFASASPSATRLSVCNALAPSRQKQRACDSPMPVDDSGSSARVCRECLACIWK